MQMPRTVIVNGKFLSAAPTGVHRVAHELVTHAHRLLQRDAAASRRLRLELWIPRDAAARAGDLGLPVRLVAPLTGIPWEQITLPLRARGALLLSLCNVGPMIARNAVTMFHDAQVHLTPDSYGPGFRAWYRLHQPIAGRRHRRILTVSEYSREQIAAHGVAPRERIGVIHNGVDHLLDVKPDPAALERLGLKPRGYVLALANTQPHKNVRVLLEAFRHPSLQQLKLVLFGSEGPEAFEARGLAVPPGVIHAGRVSDAELRGLYDQALCLGFPSTTEGFGLPPLEAMQVGCPAVVAPCGALPEVCGPAALYADPGNPQAWVQAIADLAGNTIHREERVAAGRSRAAMFTWDRAAGRLIEELLAL